MRQLRSNAPTFVPEAKVAVVSIIAYLSLGMSPISSPCCVRQNDAAIVVRVSQGRDGMMKHKGSLPYAERSE